VSTERFSPYQFGTHLSILSALSDTILAQYGKKMTWDIKAGCMGKRELLKIVQHIIKHGLAEYESTAHLLSCFPDVPLTVPEYLEQRNARQNKLWPMVPLLPGVKKLVLHLRAHNIPMAVATSSRRTTFELKTGHLGEVFDCFDGKVVCGDDKQ
jgi:pseudouridine-5'-monophosphatase